MGGWIRRGREAVRLAVAGTLVVTAVVGVGALTAWAAVAAWMLAWQVGAACFATADWWWPAAALAAAWIVGAEPVPLLVHTLRLALFIVLQATLPPSLLQLLSSLPLSHVWDVAVSTFVKVVGTAFVPVIWAADIAAALDARVNQWNAGCRVVLASALTLCWRPDLAAALTQPASGGPKRRAPTLLQQWEAWLRRPAAVCHHAGLSAASSGGGHAYMIGKHTSLPSLGPLASSALAAAATTQPTTATTASTPPARTTSLLSPLHLPPMADVDVDMATPIAPAPMAQPSGIRRRKSANRSGSGGRAAGQGSA